MAPPLARSSDRTRSHQGVRSQGCAMCSGGVRWGTPDEWETSPLLWGPPHSPPGRGGRQGQGSSDLSRFPLSLSPLSTLTTPCSVKTIPSVATR